MSNSQAASAAYKQEQRQHQQAMLTQAIQELVILYKQKLERLPMNDILDSAKADIRNAMGLLYKAVEKLKHEETDRARRIEKAHQQNQFSTVETYMLEPDVEYIDVGQD